MDAFSEILLQFTFVTLHTFFLETHPFVLRSLPPHNQYYIPLKVAEQLFNQTLKDRQWCLEELTCSILLQIQYLLCGMMECAARDVLTLGFDEVPRSNHLLPQRGVGLLPCRHQGGDFLLRFAT